MPLLSAIPTRSAAFEPVIAVKKSVEFGFKSDEYGKEFICLTDGAAETCYRKEAR
jgi:hypothetical protein